MQDADDESAVASLKRAELMECAEATFDLFTRNPSSYADSKERSFQRERQLLTIARDSLRLRFAALRHFIKQYEVEDPLKLALLKEVCVCICVSVPVSVSVSVR